MIFSARLVKLGNYKCFAECDVNNKITLYCVKDGVCVQKNIIYDNKKFTMSNTIANFDADQIIKSKDLIIKRKGKNFNII